MTSRKLEPRKLQLNRETLRRLDDTALARVGGGLPKPTDGPSKYAEPNRISKTSKDENC